MLRSLPTWLLALLAVAVLLYLFPQVRAMVARYVPIPGL